MPRTTKPTRKRKPTPTSNNVIPFKRPEPPLTILEIVECDLIVRKDQLGSAIERGDRQLARKVITAILIDLDRADELDDE